MNSMTMQRFILTGALLCVGAPLGSAPLGAQSVGQQKTDSLVLAADEAARASNHREAIRMYELALRADPTMREQLLAKLGRQYLRSGESATAAQLLGEWVTLHPGDCELRRDAALALTWQGALPRAVRAWQAFGTRCPASKDDAALGLAQVQRWGNYPRAALRTYTVQRANTDTALRLRAALGQGFTLLDLGQPRAAEAVFDSLAAAKQTGIDVVEGRARVAWDLGQRIKAIHLLEQAKSANAWNRSLGDLDRALRAEDNVSATPVARGFRDRDGTSYRAYEVTTGVGTGGSSTLSATARRAELRGGAAVLASDEGSLSWRARPHRAFALSAEAGVRRWSVIDRTDPFGEATLTVLPGDMQRIDLTYARLVVTDNVAAINSGLAGNYVSAGYSHPLGTHTSLALSADATRWTAGNTRTRVRSTLSRRFEGTPSVTLEWPTAVQLYDTPFVFGFFSPRTYVETGPALSGSRRLARAWTAFAYGRAGALRETGGTWQPLGMVRGGIERDLASHLGLRADGSWTNSNLAGASGFERTALSLQLTARW